MDVDSGEPRDVIAAMNIVPLIDILLVLLIIFMVISPVKPVGLSAQIPQPASAHDSAPSPAGASVVRVMAPDVVLINQDVISWEQLGARLQSIFNERAEKVAFVQGGTTVEFTEVARAIDIMRAAGIEKIGLISGATATAR
ncbi:MAG: ExbD/TolR family protein [Candidatus Acidiferrales bacterium]